MNKEDLLKLVDEAGNLAAVKKIANENNLEVDLTGLNKEDAKNALREYIDSLEDDDEDEDEDAVQTDEDEVEDEDEDDDAPRKRNNNKKEKTKSPLEIAKALMKDPNRDIDNVVREIKYLNNLRDYEGDYGEYQMGTLTIDVPIEGFVASEDEFGVVTYVPGDQVMINFMVPSMIATIRNHKQLSGLYNKIREDHNLLYQLMPGSQVRMLIEYVPANTPWTNPFSNSRKPTVREYDHDVCIAMIYDIKKLGPQAEMWADMESIGNAGMSNPAVVLALLDRMKKQMK